MNKYRIAVVGKGNLGKCAVDAVNAAEDMELAGVVLKNAAATIPPELRGIDTTDDIAALGKVDAAILCIPSREIEKEAPVYLAKGINTIDSYDMHGSIYDLKCVLDEKAKASNSVSVVAAGWDPGSDSVIRSLMTACAPNGITYTNFGPGMSMGHSVAARAISGVKNALSNTIPLGTGIHRRMVYVELCEGADFKTVEAAIKADSYFSHDETHVIQVSDVDSLIDKGHAVNMVRKGVSGTTHNQLFEFNMKINNPALTSQILTSCTRASLKQKEKGNYGAFTMIELPLIDLLYGSHEQLIRQLV